MKYTSVEKWQLWESAVSIVAAWLLALATGGILRAEAPETSSEKLVRPARPRLYFTPEDIPALRRRARQEPHATFLSDMARHITAEKRPSPECSQSLLRMQIGGVLSAVMDDRSHVPAAKRSFMRTIDYWAERVPDHHSQKKTVAASLHTSRQLQNRCTEFDLLEPSGVFSDEEYRRIRTTLAMVAARLMERGETFNPYDYYLKRFRLDNWNVDRFVAVGMVALTFPDHPKSKAWLDHAVKEFRWQLDNSLTEDGAWPEGTRYHGAVLRAMIPFAYALRNNGGPDFFTDARFKAMFESFIRRQTPKCRVLGSDVQAVTLTPGVSDASWENSWSAILGMGMEGFGRHDRPFAGRLAWAWQRAGRPMTLEFSPGNPAIGFLVIDPTVVPLPQPPLTSEAFPEGQAVLRDAFDTPRESFFFFNVAKPHGHWQHQHADRGSFSLISQGTLIAIDPGARGYGETWQRWFKRSPAHNLVQFGGRDVAEGGRIVETRFSDTCDYIKADLEKSIGGKYTRHVAFVKPHFYVIWDHIEHDAPAVYNLHVLTREDTLPELPAKPQSGTCSRITLPCDNRLVLDFVVVEPAHALSQGLIELDRDKHPVHFCINHRSLPRTVGPRRPVWIRLKQNSPSRDFITVLYPRDDTSPPLQVEKDGRNIIAKTGNRKTIISPSSAEPCTLRVSSP